MCAIDPSKGKRLVQWSEIGLESLMEIKRVLMISGNYLVKWKGERKDAR